MISDNWTVKHSLKIIFITFVGDFGEIKFCNTIRKECTRCNNEKSWSNDNYLQHLHFCATESTSEIILSNSDGVCQIFPTNIFIKISTTQTGFSTSFFLASSSQSQKQSILIEWQAQWNLNSRRSIYTILCVTVNKFAHFNYFFYLLFFIKRCRKLCHFLLTIILSQIVTHNMNSLIKKHQIYFLQNSIKNYKNYYHFYVYYVWIPM